MAPPPFKAQVHDFCHMLVSNYYCTLYDELLVRHGLIDDRIRNNSLYPSNVGHLVPIFCRNVERSNTGRYDEVDEREGAYKAAICTSCFFQLWLPQLVLLSATS